MPNPKTNKYITFIVTPDVYDFYEFPGYFLYLAGGFGVAGGAHRLYSHRTYKAKWPLKIILLICFSVSGQV